MDPGLSDGVRSDACLRAGTLCDGRHLNNFNFVGTANWKPGGSIVEATSGAAAILVTFLSQRDFTKRYSPSEYLS
jgi:hypothetical protein